MQPTNAPDSLLTPEKIAEIEIFIRDCVKEIFKMMFKMDIDAAALLGTSSLKNPCCASIKLVHKDAEAYISVQLSTEMAALVAEKMGLPPIAPGNERVKQDITCELANIVGNNLRTFLSERMGIYFQMEMVKANELCLKMAASEVVKLYFHVQEMDPIEFVFSYASPEKKAP